MIPKDRAWDNINKKMISWRKLLNGNNLRNIFMRSEMCGLKLMKSTGLKDKNGVEIFEGDIITIIDNGEEDIGFGWNKVVIFHNGAFMVGDHNLLVNVNFRCVVINNIYEIK